MNLPISTQFLAPAAPDKTCAEQAVEPRNEGEPMPAAVHRAAPVPPPSPDFPEGREDPAQSRELERQQDA